MTEKNDRWKPLLNDAVDYEQKLKATPILVSVKAAAEELQKAYGSGALFADARSVEFPRQQWIRNAFEQLVKHKLAMPPTGTTDEYVILYKPFRIDVRERFARLEAAAHPPSKPDEPKQMSIPLAFEKNKDSPG